MSEVAEAQDSMLSVDVDNGEQMTGTEESVPHVATEQNVVTDTQYEWGDRPEYVPEQFWNNETGPDLEGLAKSYTELRAKMSTGKHKAPKDGNYEMSSMEEKGIPADDPLLNQFTAFAKENGLSQDQFDQITNMYVSAMEEMNSNVEDDIKAEMAKLGPKGEKIVGSLNQWLTKLGSSGALSHEEIDAVTRAATNANYISALNKIRASYGEQPIPDVSIQEGAGMTKADLDAMVADPRYGKDMHFTQNVERKFMEFFGEA